MIIRFFFIEVHGKRVLLFKNVLILLSLMFYFVLFWFANLNFPFFTPQCWSEIFIAYLPDDPFEHVASILVNISKQEAARKLLLDPKRGLLKQIIRQFDSSRPLRKKGVCSIERTKFFLDNF